MNWLNNLLKVVAETVLSSMDDSAKAARDAFLSMMELRLYLDPESQIAGVCFIWECLTLNDGGLVVGIRCVVGCVARFGNVDSEFVCLAVLESGIYVVSNPLQ